MELPIDHFRLLGVSPGSDAQAVLNMLQQRLGRPPEQGFSHDTLEARAELLRSSADLLSDGPRRATYEADLTALAGTGDPVVPALEVPSSKEVAGLLLLLEAGQPLECFELTCRCLHPPQAPALGSSREADLTLLAGHSCLDAAEEYRQQRRFEAAARTLQQGLQLLQRMGQLPHLREAMSRQLDRLTPYRVLDLLSRDLGATEERREGLALLEQLVQRRGGLEGDGDPQFPSEEFQPFFKQIRGFLTVQEQVDLFGRWGDEGSPAADFLATTALTASGFAQRKPERIVTARDRLLGSGRSGIEPLLANLHLLLGEVDAARESFEKGAGEDLRQWAAGQSDDPLGQLCAYCRDWLARDVLPGYRDLDADPDLESYFSDPDVVAHVEREDRRSGRAYLHDRFAPAGIGGLENGFGASAFPATSFPSYGGLGSSSAQTEVSGEASRPLQHRRRPGHRVGAEAGEGHPGVPPYAWLAAGIVALLAAVLAGAWLLRARQAPRPTPIGTVPIPVQPVPPRPEGPVPPTAVPSPALPLKGTSPTPDQIRALLEAWLAAKTAVLAGRQPGVPLDRIARERASGLLEAERKDDEARGETQLLQVKVKSLSIDERSPGRIAVTADLDYSDSRRNREGRQIESTPPKSIRNVYVFGRDGDIWRLAATHPAP